MGGIRIPMVCKLLTFSRASFSCTNKSYLLAQPTYDRAFGAASSLLRGALGRFALISLSRAGGEINRPYGGHCQQWTLQRVCLSVDVVSNSSSWYIYTSMRS